MHPRLITRCAWKGQSFLSDGIVWTSGSFVKWRLTFGDTSDLSLQPRLFPPALCFVWTPPTLCGYLVCKLTFRGGHLNLHFPSARYLQATCTWRENRCSIIVLISSLGLRVHGVLPESFVPLNGNVTFLSFPVTGGIWGMKGECRRANLCWGIMPQAEPKEYIECWIAFLVSREKAVLC